MLVFFKNLSVHEIPDKISLFFGFLTWSMNNSQHDGKCSEAFLKYIKALLLPLLVFCYKYFVSTMMSFVISLSIPITLLTIAKVIGFWIFQSYLSCFLHFLSSKEIFDSGSKLCNNFNSKKHKLLHLIVQLDSDFLIFKWKSLPLRKKLFKVALNLLFNFLSGFLIFTLFQELPFTISFILINNFSPMVVFSLWKLVI